MPKPNSAARVTSAPAIDADDLRFDGLAELLGYRVRRAQGAMHRDFVASLASLALTQKQAATLWLIDSNPGVSQATLAAALGMDRATMMSVVDRLEERGFTIRRRSVSDRRRQELHLTPLGQSTLKKARAKIAEHERRFAKRLNAPELEMLSELLRRLGDE